MPSIGSKNFIYLRGGVNPPGERLEDITRPNVDGIAYRKIGVRGSAWSMISLVDVGSAGAAESVVEDYLAMQGTLQTVTDDHGNSYTNIAILHVQHLKTQYVMTPGGGMTSGNHLVMCQWTLQDPGSS